MTTLNLITPSAFLRVCAPVKSMALQWKNIDLQRREIHIREALVNGVLGGTKTYGSDRTIQMNDRVYQAFLQQKSLNNGKSDFVFCNRDGGPLDYRLVNQACLASPAYAISG